MANLLSKESQKNLRRAQRARLVLAAACAALAAALIGFAALLPAFIFLRASRAGSAAQPPALALASEDRAALQEIRGMVSALKPITGASTTPSQAILRALSLKPASVAVDRIAYSAGAYGTIIVSGASQAPSALDAYRSALAADPRFSGVSVPVSALIGAAGGRFTMTLTGDF